MSVEEMRFELGREAKEKGETLHGTASESFKEGYLSSSKIGSNVLPKHFGKASLVPHIWSCVHCGYENKSNVRRVIAGRVVCWSCGEEG